AGWEPAPHCAVAAAGHAGRDAEPVLLHRRPEPHQRGARGDPHRTDTDTGANHRGAARSGTNHGAQSRGDGDRAGGSGRTEGPRAGICHWRHMARRFLHRPHRTVLRALHRVRQGGDPAVQHHHHEHLRLRARRSGAAAVDAVGGCAPAAGTRQHRSLAGGDLHGAVSFGDRIPDLLPRPRPHDGIAGVGVLLFAAGVRIDHGGRHFGRAPGRSGDRRRRGDPRRRVSGGARLMASFVELLRRNRNYRYTWIGQVVSEIGDHFNNIAVFSLMMQTTHSGLEVSGVMLSRAVPAVLAGPLAGVVLDRLDRKRIMIASDLVRAVVALAFVLTVRQHRPSLLYGLSALLMFASPFFTSGRISILPTISSREELHTANSLTQTTQWTTLTIGTMVAGLSAARLGYQWAFVLNSLSFLASAACIWQLRAPGSFRAKRQALTEDRVLRPWHEYKEGLRY